MAQITQRFEVAASEFPLFSDLIGRTIVAEEDRQTVLQTSATQLPSPFKKPQMMYAENILPVTNGYRSVGFQLRGAGLPGGRTLYNCWRSQEFPSCLDCCCQRLSSSPGDGSQGPAHGCFAPPSRPPS